MREHWRPREQEARVEAGELLLLQGRPQAGEALRAAQALLRPCHHPRHLEGREWVA